MTVTINPSRNVQYSSPWPLWQKLLFRFFACYLLLSCFPFPLNYLPGTDTLQDSVYTILTKAAILTGNKLLHLEVPVNNPANGSGDTLLNYLFVLLNLLIACCVTLIWSIADRKRPSYSGLLYWTMVLARYYVGFALISYASYKLFKTQFPYPSAVRLTQQYGDSSPMGLAWTFLGYSYGYNLFMGAAEAGAGLLLLFRKTKTAGALLASFVAANILAINLCLMCRSKYTVGTYSCSLVVYWRRNLKDCIWYSSRIKP